MGYAYVLVVEEDLTKLGLPDPSEEDVVSAWHSQGGQGKPPAELLPHIRIALMRTWLETHRHECLGELDEIQAWAMDGLSWRPLLEEEILNDILAERGSLGFHREFYSERSDAWFDPTRAQELVAFVVAHSRSEEPDEYVKKELDAFRRIVNVLVTYNLRFRFDFSP